ncbi:DNA-binding transcriptional LysR family regulator [Kribbella voronezhensis]|uniref:DNA-binding transcriptional LysR family regulator n=2 Tax=Kribbella voronezhensis TaxID=2512212 RepID=A0A4R7TG13_9ACTN|nr:DNA-binding transcriptional LysR family regulator [Kribbella voronezhensis]
MRYYVAVAEELHFGRAAAHLHISTPTLSQQIKQVEREIGTPLLIRHSRGVELTVAGKVFLDHATCTIAAAERALTETRRTAGLGEPQLRLGLLNGVPGWLPAALENLASQRSPGCKITPVAGTTAEQLAMLASGDVDLALIRTPATLPTATTVKHLAEEELGVLLTATHPLAAGTEITLAQLRAHELIWINRAAAPDFYDDAIHRLGGLRISPTTMSHSQLRSALLVRRDAITLGSRRAADDDVLWRPIEGSPLHARYAAAWRTDSRNPVLHALLVSPGLTPVRKRVVDL